MKDEECARGIRKAGAPMSASTMNRDKRGNVRMCSKECEPLSTATNGQVAKGELREVDLLESMQALGWLPSENNGIL